MEHYAQLKIAKAKPVPAWKATLLPSSGTVLDVGCGAGQLADAIGAGRVVGMDLRAELAGHCASKGLRSVVARVPRLPFGDGSFAGVWCSHLLEHLDSGAQSEAVSEFRRVLFPGGRLVVFAPTPYHWYFWDDATHVRPLTHGSLANLAGEAGLRVVQSFYSRARWLPGIAQRYMRVLPLPHLFWEACLVAERPR